MSIIINQKAPQAAKLENARQERAGGVPIPSPLALTDLTPSIKKTAIDSSQIDQIFQLYLSLHEEKPSLSAEKNTQTLHRTALIKDIFKKIFTSYQDTEWDFIDQKLLVSLQNEQGVNVFLSAVQEGHIDCFRNLIQKLGYQKLIQSKDLKARGALHLAVIYKRYELISDLIQKGYCSIQDKDIDGLTPFHLAIHEEDERAVEILLKNAAVGDPWIPPKHPHLRISSLALAVVTGNQTILCLLLKHDVFKQMNFLEPVASFGTILHLALHANQSHLLTYFSTSRYESTHKLLTAKDTFGRTPLQLAAFLGDLRGIQILTKAGAPIHQGSGEESGPPLLFAAKAEEPEAVSYLIELGADPSQCDQKGLTPLQYLIQNKEKSPAGERCKNILANAQLKIRLDKATPFQLTKRLPHHLVIEGQIQDNSILTLLKALEEQQIVSGLKRLTGQGVGLVVSALIAVGYTAKEIQEKLPGGLIDLFLSKDVLLEKKDVLFHTIQALEDPLSLEGLQLLKETKVLSLEHFEAEMEKLLSQKTHLPSMTFKELRAKVRELSGEDGTSYKHLHLVLLNTKTRNKVHISSEDNQWDELVISSALTASFAGLDVFSSYTLKWKNKEGHLYAIQHPEKFHLTSYFQGSLVDIFDANTYQEDPYLHGRKTNYRTAAVSIQHAILFKSDPAKDLSAYAWALFLQHLESKSLTLTVEPHLQDRILTVCFSKAEKDDELASFCKKVVEETFIAQPQDRVTFKERAGKISSPLVLPWKYSLLLEPIFIDPATLQTKRGKLEVVPQLPEAFIERKEQLTLIEEVFKERSLVAITGLGGVGKSSLAAGYAHISKDTYEFTFFAKASTEVELLEAFNLLAKGLKITGENPKEVMDLLSSKLHRMAGNYLLIFDGIDDASLFSVLGQYLPKTPYAKILVTTRLGNDIRKLHFHPVPLKSFTSEQAADYLLKAAAQSTESRLEAKLLATRLGNLPLALSHAGSYILDQHISFKEYCTLLDTYKLEVFEENSQDISKDRSSILTTWNVSIKAIIAKEHGHLAKQLLEKIVCLGEGLIPFSLLKKDEHELILRKALGHLLNYSLIEHQSSGKTQFYEIHSLVKEVLHYHLTQERKDIIYPQLILAIKTDLGKFSQEDEYDRKILTEYAVHTVLIIKDPEYEKHLNEKDRIVISYELGKIYHKLNLFSQALSIHLDGLKRRQKLYGENSEYTAESYQSVGNILRDLGRSEEALQMQMKALEIKRKALGEESIYTATSYQDVGNILKDLGRSEEALQMQMRALEISRKALGEESIYTAGCYQDVGNVLTDLGRSEEALQMQMKALEIKRKALGEESPYTAASYQFVGNTLKDLGRSEEALQMQMNALQINRKALGEESRYTATSYQSVGTVLKDLGKSEEALGMQMKALEINRKALGEESRYTATSYQLVGNILRDLVRIEEALQMQIKALEIKRKALGEESRYTAESYQSVGNVLKDLGKSEEALQMQMKALEINRKALGEESRYTAESYQFVGNVLKDLGRSKEALQMQMKALEINRKALGEESRYTAGSYQDVGNTLKDLRRTEEALQMQMKALEINRKALGEESIYTAASYQFVGNAFKDLGRSEEALQMQMKALEINRKALGEESIYTAASYQLMGNVLNDLGRSEEALGMQMKAIEINRKALGEESIYTAASYQFVGNTLRDLGRTEEALGMQMKALEISRKALGEESIYTAGCYQSVGNVLTDLGRNEEALQIQMKGLEINRKALGEESRYTAASYQLVGNVLKDLGRSEEALCYQSVGNVLTDLGRYEEALQMQMTALEINRKVLGEESVYTAESYQFMGNILKNLGRIEEALQMQMRALEINRKVLGEESRYTATSYQFVGNILKDLGRSKEALQMQKKALEINRKALGEESIYTATSYQNVGNVLKDLGRIEEALQMQIKALEINRKELGEESRYTAGSYQNVGNVLKDLGRIEEALQMQIKALEINRKELGEESRYTAGSYQFVGNTLKDLGRSEEALQMQMKALEIKRKVLGEESIYTATSYRDIGDVLKDREKLGEALQMTEKSLAIMKNITGETSRFIADSYRSVGLVFKALKDFDNSFVMHNKALVIRLNLFGDKSRYVAESYEDIADLFKAQKEIKEALKAQENALKIHQEIFKEDSIHRMKSLKKWEEIKKLEEKLLAKI